MTQVTQSLRGVGVGFKPRHFSELMECPSELSWLQVHAENYMTVHGGTRAQLEALAAHYPISVHGVGLFTRLAAFGMIGFIVVQTLTDIYGHGVDAATTGALFDAASDGLIFDQRLLWVTVLFVIFTRGPGTLSLDKLLGSEMHTNEI